MDTLLIIEDDKLTRTMLRDHLESEDFVVIEAANGNRGQEILTQHHIDLVLLDIHLPDGSGLDFMKIYRETTNIPVLIVSGSDDKESTISGLSRGADDYIHKPFDPDDLTARIKANLRRYRQGNDINKQQDERNIDTENVAFGQWILDRKRMQLYSQDNQPAALTSHEFNLLDLLIKNAGQAIRREDLCNALREKNYVPAERAIDVKITRIRKKIEDSGENPQIIKTVRGVGYMFAEVIRIHR